MDIEELTSYDLEDENKKFTDEKIRRVRFRLLKLLDKGYNIVVYIGGSSARTDVFRKFVRRLIPIDNRTK